MVQSEVAAVEAQLMRDAAVVEAHAVEMSHGGDAAAARDALTNFSVRSGQGLLARWLALWARLFVGFWLGI